MAGETSVTDWTNLKVQRHWYKLRHELDHEIQSATDEVRKDYDISLHLNTATIVGEDGRSVLRLPVSASWRGELEQTIAYVLVSSDANDEPRMAAIGHGIEVALQRWIPREVPIGAAPVFLYPEPEVRWPELDEAQGQTVATASARAAGTEPAATPAAAAASTPPAAAPAAGTEA
jgi:hypothetical protein